MTDTDTDTTQIADALYTRALTVVQHASTLHNQLHYLRSGARDGLTNEPLGSLRAVYKHLADLEREVAKLRAELPAVPQ